MTITIIIGNSDDKLTQMEWSQFCAETEIVIDGHRGVGNSIHFHGTSPGSAPWQNAAWVIELNGGLNRESLMKELAKVREKFRQDSVAVVVGDTAFI